MPAAETATRRGQASVRSWLPEMVVNAALPYATYLVLTGRGVSTVAALTAGAVFPAALVIGRLARSRRLDGLGIAVLVVIALSVALSLVSGSARFVLVKESFFSGAFGIALLGSLVVARRPLMFYTGRKFATDGSPAGIAAFDSYWPKSATFRRSNRVMTLVWGVAFLVEAAARVIAAYTLPTSTVVALSTAVPLVVIALLMIWTVVYGKRTRPQSRAEVMAFDRG